MIDIKTWDALYRSTFDWVLRRLEPDTLDFYKDKEADWLEAVRVFNSFQLELFKLYSVNYKSRGKYKKDCIKGLELTSDQLFDITHKYIKECKTSKSRYFIFHWWTNLRHYVEGSLPHLCYDSNYIGPATKEEIEFAREHFGKIEDTFRDEKRIHKHTFKDNAQVLTYRDTRYIIDEEWGEAWTLDKNGKPKSFSLDWDWWYPIDEYLDLN